MTLDIFKYESLQVRTLGTPESPLFVASDICAALGHSNPRQAIKDNVYPEDVIKAEIKTSGGRQVVNCVNESGLYALIFRSKLESAKKFKYWVTSEVLPAIRKTGKYELPRETITAEEQYYIRKAVASNASRTGRSFQTVYNSLYDEFQIPRYQELKREDFQKALEFLDFKFPEKKSVPEGSVVLDETEAQILLTFVYSMRYLYRGCFTVVYKFLEQSHSPLAGRFCECINDIHLAVVEKVLDDHGYRVKDMDCYKYLISHKA